MGLRSPPLSGKFNIPSKLAAYENIGIILTSVSPPWFPLHSPTHVLEG